MNGQDLAKEKIKLILDYINEIRAITPKNEPIKLSYSKLIYLSVYGYSIDENFINSFLKKLELDKELIKINKFGKDAQYVDELYYSKIDDDSYIIEIKDGFNEYCNEIFADDNNINKNITPNKKELRISYSEHSRKIILNDFFLIAKPDFDSENEQIFHYLYRNPNKSITKSEIISDLKITLTKDFSKIIENLNFKKNLRDAFFDVSKNSIQFHNPVLQERLNALDIKEISIQVK
jgi:hypothetical protein